MPVLISASRLLAWSNEQIVGSATGLPLEKLLSVVPTQSLASVPLINLAATPPVSASAVGRAAVAAATDPAVPPGEHSPTDVPSAVHNRPCTAANGLAIARLSH